MSKIIPSTLKKLRERKGWSQRDLAKKAGLDNQTICRLEQGAQGTTRPHTVQSLARAFGVDPSVLTDGSPVPDDEIEDDPLFMSRLSMAVSTRMHNALYLTAQRYGVSQQDIVELAPYLFCCAAEASLRERRGRLAQAERACANAQSAASAISHLDRPDFSDSEEKFAAEKDSIEQRDLFASSVDGNKRHEWTDNPFVVFLDNLADVNDGVANLEGYGWRDSPEYSVCPAEASDVVNGDSELAKEILGGHVSLNAMPKSLREIGRSEERVEWIRRKLKEFREEMRREFERSTAREATK